MPVPTRAELEIVLRRLGVADDGRGRISSMFDGIRPFSTREGRIAELARRPEDAIRAAERIAADYRSGDLLRTIRSLAVKFRELLAEFPGTVGLYDPASNLIYSNVLFDGYRGGELGLREKALWANILAHERTHRRKRLGAIAVDVPTASAFGHLREYETFREHRRMDEYTQVVPAEAAEKWRHAGVDEILGGIDELLTKYAAEQQRETVESYPDGALLCFLCLCLFGGHDDGHAPDFVRERFRLDMMPEVLLEAFCHGLKAEAAMMTCLAELSYYSATKNPSTWRDEYRRKFLSPIKSKVLSLCVDELGITDAREVGFILVNTLDEIETAYFGEPTGLNPF